MLDLRNDVNDVMEFLEKKKQIVLYGAGASAQLILASYYNKGLCNSLRFIVDVNERLDGSYFEMNDGKRVAIVSLKRFCESFTKEIRNLTLLMSPYYSISIIQELDKISKLDGIETYVFSLIVNNRKPERFVLNSACMPLIPKKIHYFWLGETSLPDEYKRNIESWRKYCPDYEIIRWDESNYDFSQYRYAKEAIENRQYMYATDLARKDVLYTYGGIYFDTDVELLRPIDELLYNEAFIGIDDGGQVNSGSGLGAVEGHPVIKALLDVYRDKSFVNNDGSLNLFYNTYYETKYMIEKGYTIQNEYQKVNGMVCFPREVFMPEGVVGLYNNYTNKTVANHKINPCDKSAYHKIYERVGMHIVF